MADTIKLATKPTVGQQARDEAVEILEDLLKRARDGQIEGLAVVGRAAGGRWFHEQTTAINFPEAIGRMFITMVDWVGDYRRTCGER